jgi:hypothetical protein
MLIILIMLVWIVVVGVVLAIIKIVLLVNQIILCKRMELVRLSVLILIHHFGVIVHNLASIIKIVQRELIWISKIIFAIIVLLDVPIALIVHLVLLAIHRCHLVRMGLNAQINVLIQQLIGTILSNIVNLK